MGMDHPCSYIYQDSRTPILSPSVLHPYFLQLPHLKATTPLIQIARLQPTMTTHSSYKADYTKFIIPVIKVNGKNVEGDSITDGYVPFVPGSAAPRESHDVDVAYSIRNKYSPLCHEVVTACDSGKTLEEGLQAYHEHQQTKINELQVSHSGLHVAFAKF